MPSREPRRAQRPLLLHRVGYERVSCALCAGLRAVGTAGTRPAACIFEEPSRRERPRASSSVGRHGHVRSLSFALSLCLSLYPFLHCSVLTSLLSSSPGSTRAASHAAAAAAASPATGSAFAATGLVAGDGVDVDECLGRVINGGLPGRSMLDMAQLLLQSVSLCVEEGAGVKARAVEAKGGNCRASRPHRQKKTRISQSLSSFARLFSCEKELAPVLRGPARRLCSSLPVWPCSR